MDCLILKMLFLRVARHFLRAYRLIDRFSEDIDLAVLPNQLSDNQIKRKIKHIHKAASQHEHLSCIDGHELESKGSNFRRTMHHYPQIGLQTVDDQVAPELMIEVNSFTTPSPFKKMPIQCLIADVLIQNGLNDVVVEFELEAFELNVLAVERTLIEKVLAVVKHSYHEDNPVGMLQNKIRHLYDIHQIMQCSEIKQYVNKPEFLELCQVCLSEEIDNFGEADADIYKTALSEAPIFVKFEEWIPELNKVYSKTFAAMTYKELPPLNEIGKSLATIKNALQIHLTKA